MIVLEVSRDGRPFVNEPCDPDDEHVRMVLAELRQRPVFSFKAGPSVVAYRHPAPVETLSLFGDDQ